jgi:hypothetical protein
VRTKDDKRTTRTNAYLEDHQCKEIRVLDGLTLRDVQLNMWLFLDMCIDLECVHERALEGHAMK